MPKEKKKERFLSTRTLIVLVVLVAISVAVFYALYFLFFSAKKCMNEECFLQSLWECKRASFTSVRENATWHYSIEGSTKNACKVDVEALEIKAEERTALALQGKSMSCLVPQGIVYMPEERLEYCHGLLKEAIQDIIIERMHLYIVQNIGIINQSMIKGI